MDEHVVYYPQIIMRSFNYENLSKRLWDTEIVSYIAKIHECKGRQDLFIHQKPAELDRLMKVAIIQSTDASNRYDTFRISVHASVTLKVLLCLI